MATRIYALAPSGQLDEVKENVGPTATSAAIAIVVDLAAVVSTGSTTRTLSKNELLNALNTLQQYIIADQWPPA